MTDVLSTDADALRRALGSEGPRVDVSFSRETAEWVARIVDARVRGQEVVVTRGHAEVTPTEAAGLLGMSRPQVRKLIDQGRLASRRVGTHHRIQVSSIREYLDAERAHMESGMTDLSRLQNELGLLE